MLRWWTSRGWLFARLAEGSPQWQAVRLIDWLADRPTGEQADSPLTARLTDWCADVTDRLTGRWHVAKLAGVTSVGGWPEGEGGRMDGRRAGRGPQWSCLCCRRQARKAEERESCWSQRQREYRGFLCCRKKKTKKKTPPDFVCLSWTQASRRAIITPGCRHTVESQWNASRHEWTVCVQYVCALLVGVHVRVCMCVSVNPLCSSLTVQTSLCSFVRMAPAFLCVRYWGLCDTCKPDAAGPNLQILMVRLPTLQTENSDGLACVEK